ncbi:MAG: DUF1501 domain-containing protein [Planctomycetaceae bacterium]|jgi:hypothetical protein
MLFPEVDPRLASLYPPGSSRRQFLQSCGAGFGSVALASLAAADTPREIAGPLWPKATHFPPKARRVILLWMQGGPSQMDLFDYKPRLHKESGEKIPFALQRENERFDDKARLFGPTATFAQHGQSGRWVSDLLPHLAKKVDQLCFLQALKTDSPSHPGAIRLFQTGSVQFIRPSMGSWMLYGLGSENQNLPGFVVISPVLFGDDGSPLHYHNNFLPAPCQGTRIGKSDHLIKHSQVSHLVDRGVPGSLQRRQLDFLQERNRKYLAARGGEPEIEGLIESYELAFRMQLEAPGVLSLDGESQATQELYGIGEEPTDNYGRKCLMARRLIESGVRFVQVTDGAWDHHGDLKPRLRQSCQGIDRPIAGLLTDLESRGLLDDTLVIWTGEFGRTPYDQDLTNGKGPPESRGRDHNPHCWTMWVAGAGVRQGHLHGETDEYAWKSVDGEVHVHDLHATILHLLGLDHERLTYRYGGRDFRLTDVFGRVVPEILA